MTARRPVEPRPSAAMATALAVFVTLVGLCGFTGTASSYLSSRGSGTGHALVGSLTAPTGVTATTAGSTMSVAWTAAIFPASVSGDGYYVQRFAGATAVAACGSSPSHLISAASVGCTDSGSPSGSGVPAGTYTYRVTAVFRTWTALSAASNSATVAAASLALAPASGHVGATVAISGQSFAPNAAISATYDGKAVTLTPSTATDATGSFSGASFTVPAGTSGAHTVQVSDGANTASASFTVTPSISLSPSAATVGATVTVSGSGFPASSTIAATYDGSAVTLSGTTTTTATGTLPAGLTFAVPASTAGGHAVMVTAGALSASATLTVAPSISLTPTSGVVGSSDTVTATGFAAASHVTATFNGASVALSSSTTSAAGGLSATYTVPGNPQGTYTVQLKDAATNSASATYTISATAPAIAITSCTGGNGHRNTIAGTTTQNAGTVTVKVFAGTGTEGTPVVTLPTSIFTGSSSPFGWSVTTGNAQLTAGAAYTAQATQTDTSGTSNSPTCTFTAN
jgi:hypothetical protein